MEILFSDNQLVVCIKPVGLDSEQEMPKALQEAVGGQIFPLHRLDKNVGGLMVYARTKAAAATLSKVIQEGQMIKEYVAMVHGTPPQADTWKDLLFKDSRKNKVFVVKRSRNGVKAASLEFIRLTPCPPLRGGCRPMPTGGVSSNTNHTPSVTFGDSSLSEGAESRSLVRIKLHTGRSHQIRVQFSSRGFPLVGDHKYGSRAAETEPMLYSCALTFPYGGKTLHFESLPSWGVVAES